MPPLDDAQALKLKQLTVVSLACDSKVIPYDVLLTALELKDTRTLEDCIIEGMYAGLFGGKLDQKTKEFHVTETAGRDCKPGELSEMISVLKAWVEVRFPLALPRCAAFCVVSFPISVCRVPSIVLAPASLLRSTPQTGKGERAKTIGVRYTRCLSVGEKRAFSRAAFARALLRLWRSWQC